MHLVLQLLCKFGKRIARISHFVHRCSLFLCRCRNSLRLFRCTMRDVLNMLERSNHLILRRIYGCNGFRGTTDLVRKVIDAKGNGTERLSRERHDSRAILDVLISLLYRSHSLCGITLNESNAIGNVLR